MVMQCKRCLYTSDHPLGIVLDEEGICSGCRIHEEKDTLDWDSRWSDLEKLVAPYRSVEAKYDCIVPVSGAQDSFFILDLVINKLKLKPLVVSYNKYFNTPVGIANLAKLRIAFNVDIQLKSVNPKIVKKITKQSLFSYGNPYWPCIAGQTVYPVQTAVMMKIPLIIWGAHQGLEQVGMFSHLNNVEMSRRYRKDHDLFGVGAENFSSPYDELNEEDFLNYRYPAFSDIEEVGVRGIYLGNYVRWDPLAQHQLMIKKFGFKGVKLSRTFDPYDHADCFLYSNLHDILKLYKHGYSKVTDQVSREIRFGRIDRATGKRLVAFYENQQPEYMDLFCDWLGVDIRSLRFSLNRHRNKKFWSETEPDNWIRNNVTAVTSAPSLDKLISYSSIEDLSDKKYERAYINIGKGVDWPNRINDQQDEIGWL